MSRQIELPSWWEKLQVTGLIDRGPYLVVGIVLFIIKYWIDKTIALVVFNRQWTPWDYIISGSTLTTLLRVPEDRKFFVTLLMISIPFVYIGVRFTQARLRSIRANQLLVVLFFLPVLNLILILILIFLEPRETGEENDPRSFAKLAPDPPLAGVVELAYGTDQRRQFPEFLQRIFPAALGPSLAAAVGFTAAIALVMTWLSVEIFADYGWGVFIALPFLCGLISSVLHGISSKRSWRQSMAAATLTPIAVAAGVIVTGVDGAVCVLMYLPLAIPMSWIGGTVGHQLQCGTLREGGTQKIVIVLLAFMPIFLGAERIAHPPALVYAVMTSVDVDVPPASVWNNVVAFSRIPPPEEWIFRTGVAYPIEARIDGQGRGAIRNCVFSTGSFVEPITVWDAPKLLKFDVTSNPPAMQEWSPYNIHPPHINNFLLSHGGQFRLIALPGGRTRLEGTTWYEHNLWPAEYWRLWSDFLIHRIHRRVLEHVKQISEMSTQVRG